VFRDIRLHLVAEEATFVHVQLFDLRVMPRAGRTYVDPRAFQVLSQEVVCKPIVNVPRSSNEIDVYGTLPSVLGVSA